VIRAAFAMLAACTGTSTYYVAVGSRTPITSFHHDCADATGDGSVVIDHGTVDARRPGTVETTCADGKLAIVAKPVAKIAIDGPPTVEVGRSLYLRARGLAADGTEVRLGEVQWSLERLREAGRCDHMLGTCVDDASIHVIVEGPGSARATAAFAGVAGSIAFTVK
jgi:hypothetical protein